MMTNETRQALSNVLRPAAPPREPSNVYTDDQRDRLLGVVRDHGPWKLIIAQHFASAEELLATTSGAMPEGVTATLDMFLTPPSAAIWPINRPASTRRSPTASTTSGSSIWRSPTGTPLTPSPS